MQKKSHSPQRPIALITGGAKRLGAAIAEDLAAHGFAVAVHYSSSAAQAEKLCAEIAAKGGQAAAFQADLTENTAESLIEQVAAHFAPPALLVNNASLFEQDAIGSLDSALWQKHFQLHVQAPVFLAQAMARHLARGKAGQSGLIVNMADQRVLRPNPLFFSYTLSKMALWAATQTLAQGLAPNIRVNAIGPGPSLKNERQSAKDFARQCASLPLGRGPDLAEFGRAIRFLWESPSITGQMLALDGGQHLMWQTPDIKWDKTSAG